MVDDETGITRVYVSRKCNPNARHDIPWDGDRISVTGIVEMMRTALPYQIPIQATDI